MVWVLAIGFICLIAVLGDIWTQLKRIATAIEEHGKKK